jgi:hypothetical protein
MHDHGNTSAATEQFNTLPVTGTWAGLRFSLRLLFIVFVVICVLLAVLIALIRQARQAAQQMRCQNNLKQIGLALQNYHDVYKMFPPAIAYAPDGIPMHSWRVHVAPFVVQNALYDAYNCDEAWNGPANRRLTDEIPDHFGEKYGTMLFDAEYFSYRCPGALSSQNRMCTNYVMLIDDRPGQPNGPPNRPGSVPQAKPGDSHVVILEIADSDIHWMEPRDVLLSELSFRINDPIARSPSSHHEGACVLRADGSVEILDETMTAEYVEKLLTQQSQP